MVKRQNNRPKQSAVSGMLNLANSITLLRIPCAIGLLFCPPFSPGFCVLYLLAGVTDIIDGTVARCHGTASVFGARLDTAADLLLVLVCLLRLLPVLDIPAWVLPWIGVIALIKIINIISGFVMHRKFVALHTIANKLTGALLFLLPMTLSLIDLSCSAAVLCAVATFAAIQEGHLIRTGHEVM